ncbi:Major Facilitator Superfamily [Popillia japonica]|uniref:Major Facilitator Superfamily n=1 Tax=Popillia japonica TaxID=7064 RepID=A0AAW1LFX5_POPJA
MLQTKAVEVHTVQGKSQRYERRKLSYQEEKKSENKKCYACGEGDLNFKECKYRKHKCKICIKIRHLAKLGCAIGFLIPPMIVRTGTQSEIKSQLNILFIGTGIITTIITILIVIFFKDSPPTAPSRAEASKLDEATINTTFLKSLKILMKNRNYVLLVLSYGINVGIFYAISTLLNQIVLTYYPNSEADAGRIGLLIVFAGMIGSVVCGVVLDKTRKFKETTLAVYILSFLGMIIYTFTLNTNIVIVYIVSTFLGGTEYDALAMRNGEAMGGGGSSAPKGSSAMARKPTPPTSLAKSVKPVGKTMPTKVNPVRPTTKTTPTVNNRGDTGKVEELTNQILELKVSVEGLEKERDFYFGKLRDIEVMCQEADENNPLIQKILEVLYATEDGFAPPDEIETAPGEEDEY